MVAENEYKGKEAVKNLKSTAKNIDLFGVAYATTHHFSRPDKPICNRYLCTVKELANTSAELINEQTEQNFGKPAFYSNEGVKFTTSINIENNDNAFGLALKGVPLGYANSTNYGGELQQGNDFVGGTYLGTGAIIAMHSSDAEKVVVMSRYYPNCQFHRTSFGGGEATQTIEIRTESPIHEALFGHRHFVELFFDDGVALNPNAPDGVLTTFQVGRGNDSLNVTLPANRGLPLALVSPVEAGTQLNAITDYRKWFVQVLVDGKDVSPSQIASFDHATGALTFLSPPPAKSKLMLVYVLPCGKAEYSNRKTYFLEDRVWYNNEMYKCLVPTTTGINPSNVANWQLIPLADHMEANMYRPHSYDHNALTSPAQSYTHAYHNTSINA